MKRHVSKSLSLILCLMMVFSVMMPASVTAASMDYDSHWAKDTIQSAITSGLATGYPDGSFKPDNAITRAEFFALVNNAFKFTSASVDTYTDVAADAWYAPVIARARAAGYISGYPDGSIGPNYNITRQEAALIISKVKNLPAVTTEPSFTDASGIASWSKPAITNITSAKIMSGYPDGSFKPEAQIKRAEALVAIMNSLLYTGAPPQGVPSANDTVYSSSGTYGISTETTTIDGNLVLKAPGITLQNTTVKGDLTIDAAVGDSDVRLKSVVVEGMIHVYGGGENSVYFVNVITGEVHVKKDGGPVRIVASGTTSIDKVTVETDVELEETDLTTGTGFDGITVEKTATGIAITLTGVDCDSFVIDGEGVTLTLDEDTTIGELTVNGMNAEMNGDGVISNALINANGADFENEPTNMDVASGIEQPTITPRSSRGGGGGGGGGGSSTVAVTGITVAGAAGVTTITTDGGTLQMVADVLPTNASNKAVTWTVTNGTGSATISAEGILTALTDGTVTVTATSVSTGGVSGSAEITLINQLSSESELTAFSFTDLTVTGSISGTDITVAVPDDIDVTALVATFENTAGATVMVGAMPQVSGVTANNFTNPVEYTVTAPDSSETVYTVTILWKYTAADSDAKITVYNGPATGTVVIPSNLNGNTVTAIGNEVFKGKAITGAIMPDTLTSIDNHAFEDCAELVSILIPGSVVTIGEQAFDGCILLENVNLPPGIISLGAGAFNGCSNLTTVTVPNSITVIGDQTFVNTNLTNFVFPNALTSIGEEAFAGTNLTSVDLPGTLISIGNYAFAGTNLTSVDLPGTLISIGNYAFADTNLTSVDLTGNLTNIGDHAFENTEITEITIGDGVSIGLEAFPGLDVFKTAYDNVDEGGAGTYTYKDLAWTKKGPEPLPETDLTILALPDSLETIEEPGLEETEVGSDEGVSVVLDEPSEKDPLKEASDTETPGSSGTTIGEDSAVAEQE